MNCALCDEAVAEDVLLLGGHVVCRGCAIEVTSSLIPREFPEDWPEAERVAASVRRRVADRREAAAMRMQGALL